MKLNKGDKVALIACSNPLENEKKDEINELIATLERAGLTVVVSPYLYLTDSSILGRGKLCAKVLMEYYKDKEIKAIFDLSGGDTANEILDYLNYELIKENPKLFFGYSDLTTVLNAIYTKTGLPNVLYQVRNINIEKSGNKRKELYDVLFFGGDNLFQFSYEFIQGKEMEGIVIGGNIRCLLKLAGTSYFPDFTGKVLLLESLGGEVPVMISFFNQLKQLGIFERVNGILLGTFTTMEKYKLSPTIEELVTRIVDNPLIPIAKTREIGHGRESSAIIIGEYRKF